MVNRNIRLIKSKVQSKSSPKSSPESSPCFPVGRVGGIEISNLCNYRVAKQSKASPPRAEGSGGESTMLSAYYPK